MVRFVSLTFGVNDVPWRDKKLNFKLPSQPFHHQLVSSPWDTTQLLATDLHIQR